MKPREPLRSNRENAGVDWRNQQHSQDLATVATFDDFTDKLAKSITSTLTQHFPYVCAGVGFWKRNTQAVLYITHVELLRCVDVLEFIYIKVLLQLLQSVASVAGCRDNAVFNLFAIPPALGTVQLSNHQRAGATPIPCQLNSLKFWVNAVNGVNALRSEVNAHD